MKPTRIAALFFATLIGSLLPIAANAQQLYWSQFGTISQVGRVNLDGTGILTLVQPDRALGMETLDATRQVYWINSGAGGILRANSDFSSVTTLISGLGVAHLLNLALDPAANLIFWSEADAGMIGWASLSGGPVLGRFSSPGEYPDDLAVDPFNRWLYWTTQTGEILRSRYDGADLITLLTVGSGLGSGASGLDLDLRAGKIYMSVPNLRQIVRANLDGSGLETVVSLGAERPFGMELFEGRMYWTDLDGGRLRSANLDGSDVVTILSGLTQPRQVSIMTVPEPATLALALFGASMLFRKKRCTRHRPGTEAK